MTHIAVHTAVVTILLVAIPLATSDDTTPVPADKAQLESWFQKMVGPIAGRKATLDPALVAAEDGPPKVIRVRKDGSGEFKTITDAVNSIPTGNTKRVIVSIGAGEYKEKVKIERTKPFVTFYGAPNAVPTLTFDGTAAKYGTVDSATLIVESDYFTCINLIVANSARRPDGKRAGAQAVAMRVSGDKNAFYNTKIMGFQDTICDDRNRHFFKDCYIEGTVDFIFGSGKSIYLNTELHVLSGDPLAMITAQARKSNAEDNGYVFLHCKITGSGGHAFLGRSWFSFGKVVYAYTEMSDAVNTKGWSDNQHPADAKKLYNGEYKNTGPGADPKGRVGFTKQLGDADAKPFLSLGYIEGSKWLLPLPKV